MARMPAAAIDGGVGKSGSPAPSETMSSPLAFMRAALAEIASVADSSMRRERALGSRPVMAPQ